MQTPDRNNGVSYRSIHHAIRTRCNDTYGERLRAQIHLPGGYGIGFTWHDDHDRRRILFRGLLVWTGWIEFAFVYFANRYNVAPLMDNGEIATKPEYLIMPSSVGFWAVFKKQIQKQS